MMYPKDHCTHRNKTYDAMLTNGVVEFFEWTCPSCGGHGTDTQHALSPETRAKLLHDAGVLVDDNVFHHPGYLHRQLVTR